jgi:hypothetical protein
MPTAPPTTVDEIQSADRVSEKPSCVDRYDGSQIIIPSGAPYALWVFRDEQKKHIGWYCNLQAPLTRVADG